MTAPALPAVPSGAPRPLTEAESTSLYWSAIAALEEARTLDDVLGVRCKVEALRSYAQVAKDRRAETAFAEAKLNAERRAGGILLETDRNVGGRPRETGVPGTPVSDPSPQDVRPTLAEMGVSKNEARYWRQVARLSDEKFAERIGRLRDRGTKLTTKGLLSVHFSSAEIDYLTPREVIAATLAVMDEIDLDPAAEARGPRANVPARGHFTKKDDGLSRPWHGRVFLNPPYGKAVGAWVEKSLAEAKSGRVTESILLVASRPDTEWFRALGEMMVCFVAGRLRFRLTTAPAEAEPGPAPFPSAILYMGPNRERFAERFSPLGPIYARAMAMAEAPA